MKLRTALLTTAAAGALSLYAGHIASGTPAIPDTYGITTGYSGFAPMTDISPMLTPTPKPIPTKATAPSHICTAYITIWEDGTWAGDELIYDGKVLDKSWGDEDSMPTWGFQPMVDGTPCTMTFHD